jgi:hypothetical protein
VRSNYLFFALFFLLILACGNPLSQAGPEPQVTRLRIARYNTPIPTLTPTPTITATPLSATPTPSPTPTFIPSLTFTPTSPPTSTPTLEPTQTPTPRPTLPPTTQPTSLQSQPTNEPAISLANQSDIQNHLGYGVQLAEAKNMELAVQGGFTWAKHDLNIRPGMNFVANADNLLSDLRKSGTEHVLLKLIVWSEAGPPDAPRTAGEIEDFADNVAEVAAFARERYGSLFKTIAYEVWNEPNLNYEWDGNPNPAEYVALLRATSGAIREADPEAIIVSGAPSPGGDYDDLKFLEGMYANGAKGLMDAVGSHPYGGPWPYDHPTGIDEAGNGWPYFRKAEAQRAIMEQYGDVDTQIWATEFSWLAGVPNCDFGEHTRWQVTPEQQAEYLVAAYDYAHRNWPWMGPMFVVYDFALTGRYGRCHPAAGYSILRPDAHNGDIVSLAAAALFSMPKYPAW